MGRVQFIRGWKDWLVVTGLTLMLAWFCDGMIFGEKIPLFRDLGPYFYPIKFSVAQALQNWELPLWDRHMAAGFPVMADMQSAVFYPPSIVFALLPFFAAIRFTFLLHFAIAASGSYVLFRWWNCPPYISLIGAIFFTFGGPIVSLANVLNHFQSAVWLPWVILMCERALKSQFWKDFVFFAVVLVCQLLAGSPEVFAMSVLLALVNTIRCYCVWEFPTSLTKTLTIFVAASFVVVGLAMVQLMPTVELISQSRRDQPIPAVEAFAWSLQPVSLIGLLLPTAEADTTSPLGVRLLFSGEIVPFLISHYLGVLAILGLCSWLYYARRQERIFLIGLLGISILLACGSFTPLYPFLYDHIAMLRVFRFPEKFFFLTFALLIFASVRGLCKLNENKHAHSSWMIAVSMLFAWSAIYIFLRWKTPLLVQFLEAQSTKDAALPVTAPTLASIFFTLERQIAISLVIALLLFVRCYHFLRLALFQCLLVATVFLDLSLAHKPLQFLRGKELITNAVRVIEKPPSDFSRLFYYPPGNSLHPSFLSVLARPSFDKTTALTFDNLLPNAGVLFGFEYFQDIDALARRSYNDFLSFANPLPRERRNKLFGALNVRYLISFRQLQIPGVNLVREFPEHLSWLYEVTDPVPRAYIASKLFYEPDARSTFNRLTSDEFDLRRHVILDTPSQISSTDKLKGDVVISRYENRGVRINAQLSAPGILVLTDAFYPGWKVFVDGNEQKILRANYLFRGVELSAGSHRVEFVYDPISFKIGLLISSLTAVSLIAVPLVGWVLRRAAIRRSRNALSQSSAPSFADH